HRAPPRPQPQLRDLTMAHQPPVPKAMRMAPQPRPPTGAPDPAPGVSTYDLEHNLFRADAPHESPRIGGAFVRRPPMITVTTYRGVPPFARGLGRDLRVRWALGEAGLDYQTRLVTLDEAKQPDHRARQPFGQ